MSQTLEFVVPNELQLRRHHVSTKTADSESTMQQPQTPHVVVVMGVAGTGKTTIGPLLAARLGVPYAEGDDFHPPANIAKMTAGTPLDDDDRWPWLDAIGGWAHQRAGLGGVVSCSALKRSYRDRLRGEAPGLVFVHLTGSRELIEDRMSHREGHFMPTALLDSQFGTLQPLQPDEAGVAVDVSGGPEEIAERAVTALQALPGPA
jgi:gluconokinase